ncbi:glycosyltransferase [Rathayibacter iranicus]|uniref:glycosyltransferase n=1 Tax=Rathayibacter iranicus TaxID=59737 RepID=UPI001F4DE0E4|nr:glycosyltransferase [Rathayibacter iranicus]
MAPRDGEAGAQACRRGRRTDPRRRPAALAAYGLRRPPPGHRRCRRLGPRAAQRRRRARRDPRAAAGVRPQRRHPRAAKRPRVADRGIRRNLGPAVPLLLVGPTGWGDLDIASVADEQGLDESRVRALGVLSDGDLAVVLSRATLFVYPSIAEGFGLPVLEAMHFGVPVVHSDDPALMEVAADAGVAVERGDAKDYPERLALAMSSVLADTVLRERMSVAGRDRSRAFSWRDSAERVWALHADL